MIFFKQLKRDIFPFRFENLTENVPWFFSKLKLVQIFCQSAEHIIHNVLSELRKQSLEGCTISALQWRGVAQRQGVSCTFLWVEPRWHFPSTSVLCFHKMLQHFLTLVGFTIAQAVERWGRVAPFMGCTPSIAATTSPNLPLMSC